jgi:hypothetical protein
MVTCLTGAKNTGSFCVQSFLDAEKFIFMSETDSTGALNVIPKSQLLNQAYLDSMRDHADKLKRWYPSPRVANDEGGRPEAVFFTTSKEQKELSHKPARFEKHRIGISGGRGSASLSMATRLESLSSIEKLAVFKISSSGQVLCKETPDGLSIRPLRVDSASLYATPVFAKPGEPQHIIFGFNYSFDESDDGLLTIEPEEFTNCEILSLNGLTDVCYEVVSSSQTNLKIRVYVDGGGTAKTRKVLEGLVVSDFVSTVGGATSRLRNVTSSTDVTITTAIESPAGEYNLVFASQTIGHLLQPFVVKSKYDFSCMKNKLFAVV